MATSMLLRALRRSSLQSQLPLRLGTQTHLHSTSVYKNTNNRHFSIFNEFSKQLKGESKSNPEFQKSVKELNEKIGVVKEDLKVRTKKTTEKLYKSVDEVWTEAEETSKKVSANVKEKISAATEEVKESLGLGKEQSSETQPAFKTKPDSNETKNASSDPNLNSNSNSENAQTDQFGYESLFSKLKSTISYASPVISTAFEKVRDTKVSNLAKKGFEIVKEELSSSTNSSKMKIKNMYKAAKDTGERSTRTDVVIVPVKRSKLGEKWDALKTKMQGHPMFKRVTSYTKPVVNKGQEIAEDMRERWETSDSPVVHKIQDLNETVFGETSTGLSFKEIRRRDPSFSLPDFVAEVQEMIRPVLASYHKGELETLKKYCTKEVLERCKGERTAYEAQNMFFENKFLHISDVDVRETKMMGSTPIIILADTIHTVYYAWAMQLMDPDESDEESYFPVWRLREMQQLGISCKEREPRLLLFLSHLIKNPTAHTWCLCFFALYAPN